MVCPVVHGTRFGSVRCCVSGSGFLEQLGDHFLLGIYRRPWRNRLIALCWPWRVPLVIIAVIASDSSPSLLPGESRMSFCQGFRSWQCWQLDFSHVCVLLHRQHLMAAAGGAQCDFEGWDRGQRIRARAETWGCCFSSLSLEHFVLQCFNLIVALLGWSSHHWALPLLLPRDVAPGK